MTLTLKMQEGLQFSPDAILGLKGITSQMKQRASPRRSSKVISSKRPAADEKHTDVRHGKRRAGGDGALVPQPF